jgi:hypothetical protein
MHQAVSTQILFDSSSRLLHIVMPTSSTLAENVPPQAVHYSHSLGGHIFSRTHPCSLLTAKLEVLYLRVTVGAAL